MCNQFRSSKLIVSWQVGKRLYTRAMCKNSGRTGSSFLSDVNVFMVDFKLGPGDTGGFKLSYKSCKYISATHPAFTCEFFTVAYCK